MKRTIDKSRFGRLAYFNRTIEELKLTRVEYPTIELYDFNRTIEELKHDTLGLKTFTGSYFNRTIEELKRLRLFGDSIRH